MFHSEHCSRSEPKLLHMKTIHKNAAMNKRLDLYERFTVYVSEGTTIDLNSVCQSTLSLI